MQVKHMQLYKTGHWVVFIKLGQKHASKDGIELAVFVAFGEVLSFGPRSPARDTARQRALLRSHRDLQHTQTSTPSIHGR